MSVVEGQAQAETPNPPFEEVVDATPNAKFMTDDEYYPFLVKKNVRPGMWRWDDLQPRLAEVAKDPLRRADRRFISLVNEDTGEAGGALPSVFIGIQTFAPGEHIVPHRHNSYAVYHILQGKGYSILDGKKFNWVKGDTLVCPAWAYHEHINDGDEQVIQFVFQDMPARAMERNLIWEEPKDNTFHMVEGNVPHSDTTE
ncbi:MAG: cupin domain-containing protein [Pseudomonadota bacterium]